MINVKNREWLPDNCLTTKKSDFLIITNFFLVTGFPVPYIGILTFEGSFSSTISPILDFRYHKNIISLNKLPSPGFANCPYETYGHFDLWSGLLPYYENNTIIFLYPNNAKNLAVKYSITQAYCANYTFMHRSGVWIAKKVLGADSIVLDTRKLRQLFPFKQKFNIKAAFFIMKMFETSQPYETHFTG